MTRILGLFGLIGLLAGCGQQADDAATQGEAQPVTGDASLEETTVTGADLHSGVSVDFMDTSVSAGDDFDRFVNGTWSDNTEIPPERSRYGAFVELQERNQKRFKSVMTEAMAADDAADGTDLARSRDFFHSYMNTELIEQLGLDAIDSELEKIDAAADHQDLTVLMARHLRTMKQTPNAPAIDSVGFDYFVDPDAKNTERYLFYLTQGGLGLPGREYYLEEDEKFLEARAAYRDYVDRILSLAGDADSSPHADMILELETRMAESHWTAERSRDRDAIYNLFDRQGLAELTPGFDWELFLDQAGLGDQAEVIIWQPDFYTAFGELFQSRPVDDWKIYLRFKKISSMAMQLSDVFAQARFEMYQQTLRGVEQRKERWKEAVDAANEVQAEILSRIYLERYFPPEAHGRMINMVENLRGVFRDAIEDLEWMTTDTKAEAQKKLAALKVFVGYPEQWIDYSGLEIRRDDLVGNMLRGRENIYMDAIGKLGGPKLYGVFQRATQEVNAYYSPETGELVFLAGILQPPFFDLEADDAVNYGGIGAVIGHEISHAFDDQGRKVDEKGNLRDWWNEADAEQYEARASELAAQYDKYEPLPGLHINGRLTLGENIADLAGLTMAYRAYERSLDGEEAPVMDGYTGQQRVFIGWAQVWRSKYREGRLREQLVSGPHSPPKYRINGVVRNMPEFYADFDVADAAALHLDPENRVKIW